jgi:hypothetical protein
MDINDVENCFPIVKSGIIASSLFHNFNGKPCFLIDAKLFPGSSGSLVISKPTNYLMKEGHLIYSEVKKYVFLGIYSSNPYLKNVDRDGNVGDDLEFNVGRVCYGSLIQKTVDIGVTFSSLGPLS